jgi:riboflavin biosynthesis pyrimidine reductase
VSGHNDADRFVMGLLRSLADAVVIGAGVLRGTETGARTPAAAFSAAATDFAELRDRLGLEPTPATIVVTASGDLDPYHPAFADPNARVIVAGPAAAIDRLAALPAHVRLATLPGRDVAREIVDLVGALGGRLVVSEAGPHLGSQLIAAGVLDELFLTIAPQLAGRDATSHRLGLVEGMALWPDSPRWAGLASIRRGGDHLFLRYQFGDHGNGH